MHIRRIGGWLLSSECFFEGVVSWWEEMADLVVNSFR